ncbi:MAG TPA: YceI family protein [Gemmatimonadales bacterium]|nr:YceI family protein [Gemmatimonadales bacterium]
MTTTPDILTGTVPAASTWEIDAAHTDIGFAVKHLMISTVRGRFAAVRGTIRLDEDDLAGSTVEVEIDAASIDTRQEQRDAHLRSGDFFDVEAYPVITFRSRAVEAIGEGRFKVTGDLTMHGVTREVVLDASDEGRGIDPWGNQKAAFTAVTKIDRRDFGLGWNQALETGGVLVANEIRITLDVQAVRA